VLVSPTGRHFAANGRGRNNHDLIAGLGEGRPGREKKEGE